MTSASDLVWPLADPLTNLVARLPAAPAVLLGIQLVVSPVSGVKVQIDVVVGHADGRENQHATQTYYFLEAVDVENLVVAMAPTLAVIG